MANDFRAFPAVSDPVRGPDPSRFPFSGFALSLIRDPRDLPFLGILAYAFVVLAPTAVALASGAYFRWWLAALYLAGELWMLGPFILMLHNVSHRPFFRPRMRFLSIAIDWIAGPLFGLAPGTYFAHHVGMHHPENNLAEDLSSTIFYQRDSFVAFMRYFGRFLFGSYVDLPRYLVRRRRFKLLRRVVVGEVAFWATAAFVATFNWRGALVVFALPALLTRFGMMSGNWVQHAFVDAGAPGNCYRNSITCINTLYNRRCFNDGYHIGHHLRANRHWTEMPGDFVENAAIYAREQAIVFVGLDYHTIWLLLMLKRHHRLARSVIDWSGRGEAEIVALLRSRLKRLPRPDEGLEAAPAPA
jgi:Fatty acid desaturase